METVDFIKQFPLHSFSKGEVVMSEGEILDTLFSIKTGYIKVTSLDATGIEHLLWIAGRDDIIPGEHFFSNRTKLSYFYTTLTDTVVYCINKKSFLEYTRQHSRMMSDVAASMSDYYDDLLLRIASIDQPSIHDRLIATLKYLAQRFGSSQVVDLHALGLPLTHQDIAEMIGSTRETTSLELERLRKCGLIEYNRTHFTIHLPEF